MFFFALFFSGAGCWQGLAKLGFHHGRPVGSAAREARKQNVCPNMQMRDFDGGENVLEKYKKILADVENDNGPRKSTNAFSKLIEQASKLKTCQTDYDCNPGGRNYPLRCVNFLVSSFCVDSDDWTGGTGIRDVFRELAPEPIPVRIQDGYITNPGQPGWPGR